MGSVWAQDVLGPQLVTTLGLNPGTHTAVMAPRSSL